MLLYSLFILQMIAHSITEYNFYYKDGHFTLKKTASIDHISDIRLNNKKRLIAKKNITLYFSFELKDVLDIEIKRNKHISYFFFDCNVFTLISFDKCDKVNLILENNNKSLGVYILPLEENEIYIINFNHYGSRIGIVISKKRV